MKLVYFFLIVIVIYLVASNVKVVHMSELSSEEQNELINRSKVRSMLINSHIKSDLQKKRFSSEQKNSRDYKHDQQDLSIDHNEVPSMIDLIELVKSKYLSSFYRFNVANRPTTTSTTCSKQIRDLVMNEMEGWNSLVSNSQDLLVIKDFKCIYVIEAGDEFSVKGMASAMYLGRTAHFRVCYYGKLYRSLDQLQMDNDVYEMQLTELALIPKNEFLKEIPGEYTPFLALDKQMEYVNYINQMHQNENI